MDDGEGRPSSEPGLDADERSPRPTLVRVGGTSPLSPVAVAIVAVALAVAIVKPWGGASDVADPLSDVTTLTKASPTTPVPSTPPSSPVPRSSAEIVADQCRAPGGWRIFTIERWHDVTVHVWSAIEPVRTSDPHDPAIPYLSIVAEDVPALGYCAPLFGPERPPDGAVARLWHAPPTGAIAALDPPRLQPPFESALVAVYAPPSTTRPPDVSTVTWPSGRYLFDADGRMFGIDLRIVASAPQPSAPAGLAPPPSGAP
jgi:hypothetical protein